MERRGFLGALSGLASLIGLRVKADEAAGLTTRVRAHPIVRDVAPVVLWSLDKPIELAPGEKLVVVGCYRDPRSDPRVLRVWGERVRPPRPYFFESSGPILVAMRSSDHCVTYHLENPGASPVQLTRLQAVGYGAYELCDAPVCGCA